MKRCEQNKRKKASDETRAVFTVQVGKVNGESDVVELQGGHVRCMFKKQIMKMENWPTTGTFHGVSGSQYQVEDLEKKEAVAKWTIHGVWYY